MANIDDLLARMRSQNLEIDEARLEKVLHLIDVMKDSSDFQEAARNFAKTVEVLQTFKRYGLLDDEYRLRNQVAMPQFTSFAPSCDARSKASRRRSGSMSPPINLEYLLYVFLRSEERDAVIGDLNECYRSLRCRFNKQRADIWFCSQVVRSLLPLTRRVILRFAGLLWLGRVLRRLIS